MTHFCVAESWSESFGSLVLYELDPKEECIICNIRVNSWKVPVVPVGDFRTVPHGMRAQCSGALADRTPSPRDGCPVRYDNSWALGWSARRNWLIGPSEHTDAGQFERAAARHLAHSLMYSFAKLQ